MATRKNNYYVELIGALTPADILPGAMDVLNWLKEHGIKVAIGSSSRNTPIILKQIGLDGFFDAVADGNQITRSKPDPEVFLLAAKLLGLDPAVCMVVEDADAGVEAALAGGMRVLGVGSAMNNLSATYRAETLEKADIASIAG
jgi:beta-phosphoglucomutase